MRRPRKNPTVDQLNKYADHLELMLRVAEHDRDQLRDKVNTLRNSLRTLPLVDEMLQEKYEEGYEEGERSYHEASSY